jgi:hypothetical protein
MPSNNRPAETVLSLGTMHTGQVAAFRTLLPHRFKVLRCGRRFGKTDFAKMWIAQGLIQGEECAWFAPQHRTWSEVYPEMAALLRPILDASSKGAAVMRFVTGGRLDFWTLENAIAGRGRRYHRIVVDEAAFAKDGDNKTDASMMELWEKAIKPTLYDYSGQALICSNSAGKKSDNFFYNICTDPQYGFHEYHATTLDNPTLPKRMPGEDAQAWIARRQKILADLKTENDPLVYAQEYLAEFVNWAGVAFFSPDKWMQNGMPVAAPQHCDGVFAVIDTAIKTGYEHDGTAVIYYAINSSNPQWKLTILDWDIQKIEGASLEHWLPSVYQVLDGFAKQCGARSGSIGVCIEDKGSGTVLLQQARRRGWKAHAIDTALTSMGKDERALSVSGYHFRGLCKITDAAFNKVTNYNRRTLNHFIEQVTSFRMADKDASKREDDLLDAYTYGLSIALGDRDGW